MSKIIKITFNN